MSDSKLSPNVDYPRLLVCRKCGGQVDGGGWCARCARRRSIALSWVIGLVVPAIGFGSCLLSVLGSFHVNDPPAWVTVSANGCWLVPIGIIGATVYWARQRKWIEERWPLLSSTLPSKADKPEEEE